MIAFLKVRSDLFAGFPAVALLIGVVGIFGISGISVSGIAAGGILFEDSFIADVSRKIHIADMTGRFGIGAHLPFMESGRLPDIEKESVSNIDLVLGSNR